MLTIPRPLARQWRAIDRAAIGHAATHPVVLFVLAPFLATRIALFAVALVTFRLPLSHTADLSANHLLTALSRWDGAWYFHIAEQGYGYRFEEFSALAFSPLLPLLMRGLGTLLGHGADGLLVAGALVANVATFAACVLLMRLVALDHDPATARRAPLYLLVFPTSFFLSAIYPESLFLALALGAFLLARRGQWAWAGVLAALCVLARPHGILVAPALALEYLHQRDFSLRAVRSDAVALLLPPATFAAWLIVQWRSFGDPLAFLHAQAAWQREVRAPWEAFTSYFTGAAHGPWNDLLFALLFVALAVVVALTQRPSYALFAALFVLVPISTGQLYSMMRFGLDIFPLFIALALLGRSALFDRVYVPAGLVIGGAFMVFFVSELFFLA